MFQRGYCSPLDILWGNDKKNERNVQYRIRVILIAGVGTDHQAFVFNFHMHTFFLLLINACYEINSLTFTCIRFFPFKDQLLFKNVVEKSQFFKIGARQEDVKYNPEATARFRYLFQAQFVNHSTRQLRQILSRHHELPLVVRELEQLVERVLEDVR